MTSSTSDSENRPTIIERSEHTVSRSNISESALKVLYRLKNHNYQAFLVGGAVRDLLLGGHPKDFDIATDASPEEVRNLFRNCRLIGRRFRLAHVRFGREIIEVATFRANENPDEDNDHHKRDDTGRILRDNVFGEISEDVWRRDFTANALYYNIADFTIWDYVSGLRDINAKKLRLIGDPAERYREDPVRMLRAVRFAAKLNFSIERATERPIKKLGKLLENVPPARLYDECLKLFLSGDAARTFELLRKYGLFAYLYRQTDQFLNKKDDKVAVEMALALCIAATKNTDYRVSQSKPVTPAFLIGVFLWPVVKQLAERFQSQGKGPIQSVVLACEDVVSNQQTNVSIPRRIVMPVREVLTMQYRLRFRRGIRAVRLLDHPRFRAAYDLLLLRTEVGEEAQELADWWTDFQEMNDSERRAITGLSKDKRTKKTGRSPARRRRSARTKKS